VARAEDGRMLIAAVLRAADALRRRTGAVVEPHGITAQQYHVLRVLRDVHPQPLPTLEIGRRLLEQTPGTTRLLDRLAARGLVRRERQPANRRVVNCRIQPAGLDLLVRIEQDLARLEVGAAQSVGAAAVAELVDQLAVLTDEAAGDQT
jgi:DNA-binding MarR family transcriptional regulator